MKSGSFRIILLAYLNGMIRVLSGQFVATDDVAYQVVHEAGRMRIGTDPQAHGAIRTLPAPETIARVLLTLPFFDTRVDPLGPFVDGLRRTVDRTLLTHLAKVLHAEGNRLILTQRHVGGHHRQADAGATLGSY